MKIAVEIPEGVEHRIAAALAERFARDASETGVDFIAVYLRRHLAAVVSDYESRQAASKAAQACCDEWGKMFLEE